MNSWAVFPSWGLLTEVIGLWSQSEKVQRNRNMDSKQKHGRFAVTGTWTRTELSSVEAVALAAHTCAGKAHSPGNLRTQTACCCRWRRRGRSSPGGSAGRASPQNPSTEKLLDLPAGKSRKRGESRGGELRGPVAARLVRRVCGACFTGCSSLRAPPFSWLSSTAPGGEGGAQTLPSVWISTNSRKSYTPLLLRPITPFLHQTAQMCVHDSNYRNMSHLGISSCLLITLNKDMTFSCFLTLKMGEVMSIKHLWKWKEP